MESLPLLMEVFTHAGWKTPGKMLRLFMSPGGTRRAASSDCLNSLEANSMCVIDEVHLLLNVLNSTHTTHTLSLSVWMVINGRVCGASKLSLESH